MDDELRNFEDLSKSEQKEILEEILHELEELLEEAPDETLDSYFEEKQEDLAERDIQMDFVDKQYEECSEYDVYPYDALFSLTSLDAFKELVPNYELRDYVENMYARKLHEREAFSNGEVRRYVTMDDLLFDNAEDAVHNNVIDFNDLSWKTFDLTLVLDKSEMKKFKKELRQSLLNAIRFFNPEYSTGQDFIERVMETMNHPQSLWGQYVVWDSMEAIFKNFSSLSPEQQRDPEKVKKLLHDICQTADINESRLPKLHLEKSKALGIEEILEEAKKATENEKNKKNTNESTDTKNSNGSSGDNDIGAKERVLEDKSYDEKKLRDEETNREMRRGLDEIMRNAYEDYEREKETRKAEQKDNSQKSEPNIFK